MRITVYFTCCFSIRHNKNRMYPYNNTYEILLWHMCTWMSTEYIRKLCNTSQCSRIGRACWWRRFLFSKCKRYGIIRNHPPKGAQSFSLTLDNSIRIDQKEREKNVSGIFVNAQMHARTYAQAKISEKYKWTTTTKQSPDWTTVWHQKKHSFFCLCYSL